MITINITELKSSISLNFPNYGFSMTGNMLLDAVHLYVNTQAEMEEDNKVIDKLKEGGE